ncbi:MAG: glutaredoxin family protein [Chromatiales bacterium]|jgi:hypothetical protein|nr:glutaredoxin family protein [Chromatiales bacterium]
MDEPLPLLIVYSRRGCHLCEEMLEELEPLVRGRAQVRVNDVDTNPEWVELYGLLVPVLYYSGSEVCRYRLDRKALLKLLSDSKI